MSQLTTTDTPQTSPAQIKANRQNATRSTGPRTDSGKSRPPLNGLRHGLTSQTALMPYEDRQAYEAFIAQQIQALHPQSDPERTLAASIADDRWRLNRARPQKRTSSPWATITHSEATKTPKPLPP